MLSRKFSRKGSAKDLSQAAVDITDGTNVLYSADLGGNSGLKRQATRDLKRQGSVAFNLPVAAAAERMPSSSPDDDQMCPTCGNPRDQLGRARVRSRAQSTASNQHENTGLKAEIRKLTQQLQEATQKQQQQDADAVAKGGNFIKSRDPYPHEEADSRFLLKDEQLGTLSAHRTN